MLLGGCGSHSMVYTGFCSVPGRGFFGFMMTILGYRVYNGRIWDSPTHDRTSRMRRDIYIYIYTVRVIWSSVTWV